LSSPITVVLPDTGPLISLAAGDALELLLLARQDVRIVVTDMVHFEATHRSDEFTDGAAIAHFLKQHEGRIEIVATTIGQFALPELARRAAAGERVSMPQDLGELSITNFVISIRRANPGDPMLVLIEDDWFIGNSYAVPGNVHLLSTASFLDGHERAGVIPSAAEVRRRIQQQRPHFRADWQVDQAAPKIEGGTQWASRFGG
jgi:hypothetical protein